MSASRAMVRPTYLAMMIALIVPIYVLVVQHASRGATNNQVPSANAIAVPSDITGIIPVGATSTQTNVVTVPAGVQNGDLLLAFFSYWHFATATAPAGWTQLETSPSANSGVETVWYRFASADIPGSTYSWSFSGPGPYESGGMVSYRGVDPSVEDGSCDTSGNSGTPTLCGFTTATNNDEYVGFYATENTGLTFPGDLNQEVLQQYVEGSYFGSAAADKALGAPGAIPPDSGSMNSAGWETVAIALKPAIPGTPPTATTTATATATVITATPTATATPMTPISAVGATSTKTNVVTIPDGVQTGDLLLTFFSYWHAPTSASAPGGWTQLETSPSANSGVETVWYRFATGADTPGSAYSWSFSGPGPYESGGMVAYRGVDPSVEDGSCDTSGNSGTPTLCGFTTNSAGDTYVGFFATENTGLSFPGDLHQEVLQQYINGSRFGSAAADKQLGAPEPLSADSGTMNSGGWETVALALKPITSGPTATMTATPIPGTISFVGSSQTTTNMVAVPAGVQNGDLMLAFFSYWHFASLTAPSGWTLLHSEPSGSSGVETVWYRYASGDTPGSLYDWSIAGSGPYVSGGIVAYRGVASVSAEDGNCLDSGSNGSPTLCSFSNTTAGDIYVGFYCTENTGLTPPGDLTTRVLQQYVNGSYFGSAAVDKALPSAGVNNADIGAMNPGGWETVVFALKP